MFCLFIHMLCPVVGLLATEATPGAPILPNPTSGWRNLARTFFAAFHSITPILLMSQGMRLPFALSLPANLFQVGLAFLGAPRTCASRPFPLACLGWVGCVQVLLGFGLPTALIIWQRGGAHFSKRLQHKLNTA